MPHQINSSYGTSLYERLLSSSDLAPSISISHPIIQLDEVIKQAEMAEAPCKVQKILISIQENIQVREIDYEDGLKEKGMQVLAMKHELSQAKATARQQEDDVRSIREELKVAQRDNRRLQRDAQVDRERIQELEAEKLAWLRGNGGGIEELERDITKLEAVRADLHLMADTLRRVLEGHEIELLDYKAQNIVQRGKFHLLKKDIARLKCVVEENSAASEWLAENGPSLKADFFSLRDEVACLGSKGQDVARMMARSARSWKNIVAGTNNSGGRSGHLDTNDEPQFRREIMHD